VSTRGQVALAPDGVLARLARRTSSPVLRSAELPEVDVPWWGRCRLRLEFESPPRSEFAEREFGLIGAGDRPTRARRHPPYRRRMEPDWTPVSAELAVGRTLEANRGRGRKEATVTSRPKIPRIARSDVAELLREVERYLAAVEVFRAEGCEPRWRPA
jgi:hypothetical protein